MHQPLVQVQQELGAEASQKAGVSPVQLMGHSSTGSGQGRHSWVLLAGLVHTPRQDGAMFEDWVIYKLRPLS